MPEQMYSAQHVGAAAAVIVLPQLEWQKDGLASIKCEANGFITNNALLAGVIYNSMPGTYMFVFDLFSIA